MDSAHEAYEKIKKVVEDDVSAIFHLFYCAPVLAASRIGARSYESKESGGPSRPSFVANCKNAHWSAQYGSQSFVSRTLSSL